MDNLKKLKTILNKLYQKQRLDQYNQDPRNSLICKKCGTSFVLDQKGGGINYFGQTRPK